MDLDLTTLSSTMVFAEVSNLLYDPIPYLGKTVRMQGEFSVDHAYTMEGELDLSENYFYCIIEDALPAVPRVWNSVWPIRPPSIPQTTRKRAARSR